jgi:hypothetical protein
MDIQPAFDECDDLSLEAPTLPAEQDICLTGLGGAGWDCDLFSDQDDDIYTRVARVILESHTLSQSITDGVVTCCVEMANDGQ